MALHMIDQLSFKLEMKNNVDDEATHLLLAEEMRRKWEADYEQRMHDRKVAMEISEIPENEWIETGNDYDRPYTMMETSSTSSGGAREDELGFVMHFKGLVVEDEDEGKRKFGAIGVAILDSTNAVVFEVSKALDSSEKEMNEEVAELEAFVDGLEFAFSLELKRVSYFSGDFNVDEFLSNNKIPKKRKKTETKKKSKDDKVAELVDRALLLKKSFQNCEPLDATNMNNNAQVVLDLARSSIAKQAGKPVCELFPEMENCTICLEEVDSRKIFENGECQHRFCSPCTKKHVEIKVRGRELPLCPQPNCRINLDIESCKRFITLEMYHIVDQLVKESSIPASEKVYCPDPKCSYLMSKTEALTENPWAICVNEKCRKNFCVDCKVLWHDDTTCDKRKLDQSSEKLKELAEIKKWRQCPMCSHMVELALGCNHIYCRCGHEFCYVCGFEWKNKKATCVCQLWAEENIIR